MTKPLAKHATWTSSCRQPPTVLEVNKHTRPQDTGEVHALNWKTPSQMTPSDRPNLTGQTPRMMTDLDARMYQERSETLRRVQARDYHQRRYIHALKKRKAPPSADEHSHNSETLQTGHGHGSATGQTGASRSKAAETDNSPSSLGYGASRRSPSDEQVP